MIGSSIKIYLRIALINYYIIDKNIDNKRNTLYINTLLVIAKRVMHTLYYNKDQIVKNNMINSEFIINIKLTLNFRRICSVFLNHNVNDWQINMLMITIAFIMEVFKGRPTIQ